MKDNKLGNDRHLYAQGFFEGFILSARNQAIAVQLPDMKEMNSPFLNGVADGIAEHQRKMLIDTNDFIRS